MGCGDMDWIYLAQHRGQWQILLKKVMDLLNSMDVRKLLECNFSDRLLLLKIWKV
jgi:hypothetical protein